jgi:hypothetical protein
LNSGFACKTSRRDEYRLSDTLFAKQLDVSRVVLVGHSTGAGGATHAGRAISGFSHPKSLSYGLIAPEFSGDSGPDIRDLLVLGGSEDKNQFADPQGGYAAGGTPKTLVMITGANHFGYTDDLCTPSNVCDPPFDDPNGTITREAQQQIGAAYLAALVRYYALNDGRMRSYLHGDQLVEGLEAFGVQVQSEGFIVTPPHPTHSPKTKP